MSQEIEIPEVVVEPTAPEVIETPVVTPEVEPTVEIEEPTVEPADVPVAVVPEVDFATMRHIYKKQTGTHFGQNHQA